MEESNHFNYHKWKVDKHTNPEGYTEFYCLPPHWTTDSEEKTKYSIESLSSLMGVDKDPDFWTASDAALRIQQISKDDLASRELAIYSTRRSNDFNRAQPWVAKGFALSLEKKFNGQNDPNIHPFANIPHENKNGIYGKYGMSRTLIKSGNYYVKTGFGIREGQRPEKRANLFSGGQGKWISWSTLLTWKRIPRRQDIPPQHLIDAKKGKLLLFISHRWEDLLEPDPTDRQLKALKVGLELSLVSCIIEKENTNRSGSGLPEIIKQFLLQFHPNFLNEIPITNWAKEVFDVAILCTTEEEYLQKTTNIERTEVVNNMLNRFFDDVLIWYDYASMYQSPRTEVEQKDFERELQLLNKIQEHATTVVLADNEGYLSRGWCFLEVSGGIRNSITELTPSWAEPLSIYKSLCTWASISDQLIGALKIHGLEAINSTELLTTHSEDLPIISKLLSELPLMGLIESDGMDLIGGHIPLPYIKNRGWAISPSEVIPTEETLHTDPIYDYGDLSKLPEPKSIIKKINDTEPLNGECGMWVYSTQKMLSLTWYAKAKQFYDHINTKYKTGNLESVCCTWADSRGYAEDGTGWSGYISSSTKTLIIVTQTDIPDICLIYNSARSRHLAAGCKVLTFNPETGKLVVAHPAPSPKLKFAEYDIMRVLRFRRSTAYLRYLLLPKGTKQEQTNLLTALRLDPSQHTIPDLSIDQKSLLSLSCALVLVEAECRTKLATWEIWKDFGLNPLEWTNYDEAIEKIGILKAIIQKIITLTANPLKRRELLYKVLEKEEGELTSGFLQKVNEIVDYLSKSSNYFNS